MQEIMTHVYWSFGTKTYETYEEFIASVTEYNTAVNPEETEWDPNQVVSASPIKIVYEAPWKDEDDTLDLDIGLPGVPLTMGQILFNLNSATFDFFKDVDAHFFEGLAVIDDRTYRLLIGS